MVVGIAAAAAPARVWLAARGAPPIHDVSTDLENPPRYVAVAKLRGAGSNPVAYAGEDVARQQRASYAEVRPLIVMAPPRRTLALAADTARARIAPAWGGHGSANDWDTVDRGGSAMSLWVLSNAGGSP